MYYTIYKTTNLVTGKVYVGFHKTDNLEDGYLGSGVVFKRALEKYGPENFHKEILFVFDNPEDMFAKEAELVSEDFVSDPNTYNIKLGGQGGWDVVNEDEEARLEKNRRAGHSTKKSFWDAPRSEKAKADSRSRMNRLHDLGLVPLGNPSWVYSFQGKTHTEETKAAIGAANSIHQSGEGNSQYGTCWIYSNEEKRSMKINRNDLQEWVDRGWAKGRKMKF